jgi:hypothetical protein
MINSMSVISFVSLVKLAVQVVQQDADRMTANIACGSTRSFSFECANAAAIVQANSQRGRVERRHLTAGLDPEFAGHGLVEPVQAMQGPQNERRAEIACGNVIEGQRLFRSEADRPGSPRDETILRTFEIPPFFCSSTGMDFSFFGFPGRRHHQR